MYRSAHLKVQQAWLTPWACLSTSYAVRVARKEFIIFFSLLKWSAFLNFPAYCGISWERDFQFRLTLLPHQHPGSNTGPATKAPARDQWYWPESTHTLDADQPLILSVWTSKGSSAHPGSRQMFISLITGIALLASSPHINWILIVMFRADASLLAKFSLCG